MKKIITLVAGLFSLVFLVSSSFVFADPPYRVARLSYAVGATSFVPAGEKKWVKTAVNRPLINGDMLWSGQNSKIELQLGLASARLWNNSGVRVLNLNNRVTQFKLTGGTLILNIQRINQGQYYEIDTPNLAFVTRTPGNYRIFFDVKTNRTTVKVRAGDAVVYGVKSSLKLRAGKACIFTGTSLATTRCTTYGPLDTFDNWSLNRDRPLVRSVTTKYVSREVIGYQDLDAYGQWSVDKVYGNIWIPRGVDRNWAPYRSGRWVWINRWGWTWVDNQPWGFAPFHYGRWAYVHSRWAWVPGPVTYQPVYAPALVVFVGGRNPITIGTNRGVAWFPLAPGEVYVPPYAVTRNYFQQVNVSNTNISQTYINNVYNNNTQQTVVYQNAALAPAITAVPTTAFVQSQPVQQAAIPVTPQVIVQAPKESTATVAPDTASVLGGETTTTVAPPAEVINQEAIAVTPPQPVVPFSEVKDELEKNPGTPLSEQQAQKIVKEDQAVEPAVEVVTPPASAPLPEATPTPEATEPAQVVAPPQPSTPEAVPAAPENEATPAAVTPQAPATDTTPSSESPGASTPAPEPVPTPQAPVTETPTPEPVPTPEAPATDGPVPENAPAPETPAMDTPAIDNPETAPAPDVPVTDMPSTEEPIPDQPAVEAPAAPENPAPAVEPTPTPEVVPEPAPTPEPVPVPEPAPVPETVPVPEPTPVPEPAPVPQPSPVPQPAPEPIQTPEPVTTPAPDHSQPHDPTDDTSDDKN